jgi:hypothetical protein
MRAKAIDLFHAYCENLVPAEGMVLVSARDDGGQSPLAFQITVFDSIDAIHGLAAGLEFEAAGVKLTVAFSGPSGDEEICVEPIAGPRALFVRRPAGRDFAFLFPPTEESPSRFQTFLEKTFIAESDLNPAAAREAAERIVGRVALLRKGNP